MNREIGLDLGVIFDLDGVVADTGPAHKGAWNRVAGQYGLNMTDDLFKATFGMQNREIIVRMCQGKMNEDDMCRLSEAKEACYRHIISQGLEPSAGLIELLRDLKFNRFHIGIGSSAPKANVDLVLESLGIRSEFDVCVCAEQVKHKKPNPEVFLLVAREFGVAPNRCVVLEDSVAGIEAAKAANMTVIAITTTRQRKHLYLADRIVDSLLEVNVREFVSLVH
jgi:beta-phosphoglucomutase